MSKKDKKSKKNKPFVVQFPKAEKREPDFAPSDAPKDIPAPVETKIPVVTPESNEFAHVKETFNALSDEEKIKFVKSIGFDFELFKVLKSFTGSMVIGKQPEGQISWLYLNSNPIEGLGFVEIYKANVLSTTLAEKK